MYLIIYSLYSYIVMPEYAHKPIHSGLKTYCLDHCVVAKIAAASI